MSRLVRIKPAFRAPNEPSIVYRVTEDSPMARRRGMNARRMAGALAVLAGSLLFGAALLYVAGRALDIEADNESRAAQAWQR